VDIGEVKESLARFGERYLARIYAPGEIAYALSAPAETARRLGARFAAKEATIKALRAGLQGIDPRSIEVERAPDGACSLRLTGEALAAAQRAGATSFAVSLSHQGALATAVVVAQRGASQSRLWRRRPSSRRIAGALRVHQS